MGVRGVGVGVEGGGVTAVRVVGGPCGGGCRTNATCPSPRRSHATASFTKPPTSDHPSPTHPSYDRSFGVWFCCVCSFVFLHWNIPEIVCRKTSKHENGLFSTNNAEQFIVIIPVSSPYLCMKCFLCMASADQAFYLF